MSSYDHNKKQLSLTHETKKNFFTKKMVMVVKIYIFSVHESYFNKTSTRKGILQAIYYPC